MDNMDRRYTLNEEEALLILNTPPRDIKESKVWEKYYSLTEEERLNQAEQILARFKNREK